MPKKHFNKALKQQKIAKERIRFLFKEAKEIFHEDSSLSDKYVNTARRIAMKYKLRLSKSLKRKFCKNCHRYLVPGANCRVRIHKHRIVSYCLNCRHFTRIPVK